MIIPPEFHGFSFGHNILKSLRQFAAGGGIIADFSGEFFNVLLSWNNNSHSMEFNKQVNLINCDSMQYAQRSTDWDSQLRILSTSLDYNRSTDILNGYIAGLSKVVLEASPLINAKGFSWSLTNRNFIPSIFSSIENSDLREIWTMIPLISCPASNNNEYLILSSVLSIGKGIIYTDLIFHQFLSQFSSVIDLKTLYIPAGYSDIIARFLTLAQMFSPPSPVPISFRSTTFSSLRPPVSSTVPQPVCEGENCSSRIATNPSPLKPRDNSESDRIGLAIGAATSALLALGGLAAGGYFVMKCRGKQTKNRISEKFDYENHCRNIHNDRTSILDTMEKRTSEIGYSSPIRGELSRRHGVSPKRVAQRQDGDRWESRRIVINEPIERHLALVAVNGLPTGNRRTLVDPEMLIQNNIDPTPNLVHSSYEAVVPNEVTQLKNETTMLYPQIYNYPSVEIPLRECLDSQIGTDAVKTGMTLYGNTGNIDDLQQQQHVTLQLPQDQNGHRSISANQLNVHLTISTPNTLEEARSPETNRTVRLSDVS